MDLATVLSILIYVSHLKHILCIYDTKIYKKRCAIEYTILIEEFPSEMSAIERHYIVHLHNHYRNLLALGQVKPFPSYRNIGLVEYDLALEYILTCYLRSGLIGTGDVRTLTEVKAVQSLYDFDGNIVAMSHYLRIYYRPFEMRKTLIETAFNSWLMYEEDLGNITSSRMAFTHIAYNGVRAIGCSKLITARLFPMYGYEFGCLYTSVTPMPEGDAWNRFGLIGKPIKDTSKPYPALVQFQDYKVKDFVPPLKGVIPSSGPWQFTGSVYWLVVVLIMILSKD